MGVFNQKKEPHIVPLWEMSRLDTDKKLWLGNAQAGFGGLQGEDDSGESAGDG
jgi:hypothetical protein